MAEVVALLKTQIDPELLKKELEKKSAEEGKEKTEGIHFRCNYVSDCNQLWKLGCSRITFNLKTSQNHCYVLRNDSVSCWKPDALTDHTIIDLLLQPKSKRVRNRQMKTAKTPKRLFAKH